MHEQRAPARPGTLGRVRVGFRGCVEADAGDLDESVAGIRVDGYPASEAPLTPVHEVAGVEWRLEQPSRVEHERDRARAVVAAGDERAVAAAPDVWLVADQVAGPDR